MMANDRPVSAPTPPSLDMLELCVAGPPVVHEMLDGEVIVIHLETGAYYSLQDFAGQLWALLAEPIPLGKLVEQLAQRYGASHDVVRYPVMLLIEQLLNERLIVHRGGDLPTPLPLPPPPADAPAWVHEAAVLQRFDDVAELLKLDPVHDVDNVGWPIKAGP